MKRRWNSTEAFEDISDLSSQLHRLRGREQFMTAREFEIEKNCIEASIKKKLISAVIDNEIQRVKKLTYLNPSGINEAMACAAGWRTRDHGTKSLQILLDAGANIEYVTSKGNTALLIALRAPNVDAANFLLDRGADCGHTHYHGYELPLMAAAFGGDTHCIERLLDSGCPVNKFKGGMTPLLRAIMARQNDAIKLLIRRGANIDVFHKNVLTPWSYAIGCEDMDVLKALIDSKPAMNSRDRRGDTPLVVAIDKDKYNSFDFLLQHGASANTAADPGHTLLMYSVKTLNKPIRWIERLLVAGADLEATNSSGETVLIVALRYNKWECIEFLLEKGACLHAITLDGETPLSLASKRMNTMVIHRQNSLIQKLVTNGCTPAVHPLKDKLEYGPLSSFETALLFDNIGAAGYFLVNRFLTYKDITEVPQSPRLQSLLDTEDVGHDLNKGSVARRRLIMSLSESPFSLFTLSFVAVSSALEQSSVNLKDVLHETPLPALSNQMEQPEAAETCKKTETDLLESIARGISTPCHKCVLTSRPPPGSPWPLRKMFRIEKVRELSLPEYMKEGLFFQTADAFTDPESWHNILVGSCQSIIVNSHQ